MSLEKMGLLFLLNYFNQLGTVKNHLQLALKEVLLAMNASIDIVSQTTSSRLKGSSLDLLSPLVKQAQGVLNYTIEKVSPENMAQTNPNLTEGNHLKDHIVDSIISAIDDEIENTSPTTNQKNKLKVEALQTVKEVLLNQLRKAEEKSVSASPKASSHVA